MFIDNRYVRNTLIMSPYKLKGVIKNNNGEFDPGSGQTLAACLTHASPTRITELAPCSKVANG